MAEDEKPKKRQRMSIVCVNCKARKIKCDRGRPSCGNCVKVNVGHLCHYEEPHWANRVPAPSSPSSSSATASAPVSTKVDTHESLPTDTTSINDELQRLKEQVATLENQIATGSSPSTYSSASPSLFSRKQSVGSTHAPDDSYNETVDFYDYNTLTFKRSCMEEEKPLSSSSHAKRDPYLLLMQGYSNLCNTLFKSKFGDLKRKPKNKKSRLDASLTEFLLLLGESKTPEINTVVENFIQARSEKHIFPNVGNSNDLDLLKTQIESLLPNKSVLKLYFERFKEVLYPFFPFVDLKFFEDRIFNEIVNGGNQQDSKITLIIEDKFDIIHLATFLIILRLTYISLPDSDQGELLRTPISPEFITKALYCISRFNTMRKTKLPLIQVLLYLKIYFNYSPEDGDGSKLGQSYILFGDIVSSSFVAGINRDPSNSSQLSYDGDFSNLIRRVWHGILEIDRIYSPISGNLCLIQEDSYKVLLPQLVAGEDSEIEIEIANEYKKSRRLLKLFCDLSKLINNVAKPPNVLEILKITAAMKSYLNINYNLRSMKPLKGEPKDKQKTHNFQNSKTLLYNLQANSLILSVYQNLSLIYETNDHFDVNKWKNFQFKALELAMELYNIIYKLLKHGYQDFVDRDHYFYLNRYIENTVQRVLNTLFSMLIRLYHSEDLIARGVAPPEKSSVIEELTSLTFKIAAGLNTLMQSTLGSKYYQAFKSSFRYKFLLRSLNKDGYKCIRNTASFINERFPSDPGKKYLMLRKLELRSNPKNVLNELDNSNIFITLSNPELSDLLNILKSCEILNDPFYSMDDLIWTTSFKYQENDFIHQLENLASHNSTTAIQKPFNIRQPSTNQTPAITALAEASQSLPPLPPAPSVLPQMSQASPISHILNYQQVIPSDPVLGINGAQLQSNMINLDQFLNDNFFDFDSLWNSEYGLQID
ncbi:hypothetical protein WICPIJ_004852 [Wickerhamomyces pijperi]|uniref:Zn(2)-C6 fungal-type domain-containing protein n=1 Tax=Wickerhamomyces pijperi TaxID=599730 RepID=A0A9P8Q7D7_WICPI|nr:hypothetical protein WICPIJ_004852 [Wickerhamomyces pijperi]